jgi:DNA-3-methyladenine glycosylase I
MTTDERALAQLRNLGPKTARQLAAVGIETEAQLRRSGPVEAFRLLLHAGFRPSLNAACAMAGALLDLDWRALPEAERERIVLAVDDIRRQARSHAAGPRPRCDWCGSDARYVRYHDLEWGVPVHEDRVLFEFLILEGAQAGLSWSTILAKREGYRRAFAGFDAARIARLGERERARLLCDAGIVRNRAKIDATIGNARAWLALREAFGSADAYFWRYVEGSPVLGRWRSLAEVPASTPVSDALSKDLRARGFRFVGTTICYAFMQAVGMVNDHLLTCFRHPDFRPGSGHES